MSPAKYQNFHWLRVLAIIAGLFVVLWGAADLTSRISKTLLGEDAAKTIFAPAAATDAQAQTLAATSSSTTATPFTPVRLKIPAIGVNASVEQVGKKADGSMGTPQDFMDVGWYALGGRPAGAGNAVFDGHVNNALTKAGVFEHLDQVKKGDYVSVEDAGGTAVVYRVASVTEYPADSEPDPALFSATGPSQLVLITCQGEWVPSGALV